MLKLQRPFGALRVDWLTVLSVVACVPPERGVHTVRKRVLWLAFTEAGSALVGELAQFAAPFCPGVPAAWAAPPV